MHRVLLSLLFVGMVSLASVADACGRCGRSCCPPACQPSCGNPCDSCCAPVATNCCRTTYRTAKTCCPVTTCRRVVTRDCCGCRQVSYVAQTRYVQKRVRVPVTTCCAAPAPTCCPAPTACCDTGCKTRVGLVAKLKSSLTSARCCN